jgi:hypothetical protein
MNAYHPYEGSDVSRTQAPGGMDARIEEVNGVDWVVREENAGLLASALEGVTFEDSYQWEQVEVDTAEKRARNGTSGEEVTRKRLRPQPVVRPLNPGMTGQALSEADVAGGAPRTEELPGKGKRQRRNRGDSPVSNYEADMGRGYETTSIRRVEAEQRGDYDVCLDSNIGESCVSLKDELVDSP